MMSRPFCMCLFVCVGCWRQPNSDLAISGEVVQSVRSGSSQGVGECAAVPGIVNVFIPSDRSHHEDDCLSISRSESEGVRCSLLHGRRRQRDRPLSMIRDSDVPAVVVRWLNDAVDFAEAPDVELEYGIVVDVAPSLTALDARGFKGIEAYCVYSKELQNDGALTVTWIKRTLEQ